MSVELISRNTCIIILLAALLLLALGAYAEQDGGYLYVTTQPESAMIYIDSNYSNIRTPTAKLMNLDPGVYRLALVKHGYNLYEDKITIVQGEVLEINILLTSTDSEQTSRILSKQYVEVYVTVKSTPPGADVYLDDKLIGKTPVKDHKIQTEEPKDRKLKIIKSGYKPYEETMGWTAIKDRVKLHISVELKPTAETAAKTPATELKPAKQSAKKTSMALKPLKKKKRFTVNTQVIVLVAMLIVAVAILVTRVILRLRRQKTEKTSGLPHKDENTDR